MPMAIWVPTLIRKGRVLSGCSFLTIFLTSEIFFGVSKIIGEIPGSLKGAKVLTLSFRISVGTQITIGMGICQKSNKHRHPNYCRHGNFPKLSLELPFQYLYDLCKMYRH